MVESKLEAIAKLLPLSQKYADFALLFGSSASDRMTDESDVDFAIYLAPVFWGQDQLAIREDFRSCLNRDLDLIFLNDADIIITHQVLTTGELVFERVSGAFAEFKGQKLSQYLDFKLSRKVIEDNLLKKGWPKWKKT